MATAEERIGEQLLAITQVVKSLAEAVATQAGGRSEDRPGSSLTGRGDRAVR